MIAVEILSKMKKDKGDTGKSDTSEEDSSNSVSKDDVAQEFFDAVKHEDKEGFWQALNAAMTMCDESEYADNTEEETEKE